MKRAVSTIKQGAIGGIAGYIAERGLESATGMDFIDGVLEIAGTTLGIAHANKDLVAQAYSIITERFDKKPGDVTQQEWDELRTEYPRVVEYLEKALAV